MKKKIYILIIIFVLVISGIIFCLSNYTKPSEICDKSRLPVGYNCSNYKIATILESESCTINKDCEDKLPIEYALMSSCPYQAVCLNNKCTVVCPSYN